MTSSPEKIIKRLRAEASDVLRPLLREEAANCIERLQAALRFYADEKNWANEKLGQGFGQTTRVSFNAMDVTASPRDEAIGKAIIDGGMIARAALSPEPRP